MGAEFGRQPLWGLQTKRHFGCREVLTRVEQCKGWGGFAPRNTPGLARHLTTVSHGQMSAVFSELLFVRVVTIKSLSRVLGQF